MKILMPVDATKLNLNLVDDLSVNIDLKNSTLDILYVIEQLPAYENVVDTFGGFGDNLYGQFDSHANDVLSNLKAQINSICPTVNFKILKGLISQTIHDEIVNGNYDLVVIPSYKPPKLEEYIFGRVSRHIINTNPKTSLILKPSSNTKNGVKNILIGIDGSKDSMAALAKTNTLFDIKNNYKNIYVVNVVHLPSAVYAVSPPEFSTMVHGNMVMQSDIILADAKKQMAELGLENVEIIQKTGEPVSEMAKMALELNCALVVVASHGTHALHRLILGSVSEGIAKSAKTQVAIIK